MTAPAKADPMAKLLAAADKTQTLTEFGVTEAAVRYDVRRTGRAVVIVLASGGLRCFWLEGGKVRQRTWKDWGICSQ